MSPYPQTIEPQDQASSVPVPSHVEGRLMGRLSFVCAANVCRSPMMHFTFRETVADRTDIDGWMLSSRGTRLGHDSEICRVADRMMRGHPGADRFAYVHRPRILGAKHLEEQDLVVVATIQERGRLARLSPGDRSRVFTLREATLLGTAAPTQAELEQAASLLSAEWTTPARAYAKLLSERRGLVTSPSGRWLARGLLRFPDRSPLDIADGHHGGLLQHTMTLRRVRAEAGCLADQMLRFLDALA